MEPQGNLGSRVFLGRPRLGLNVLSPRSNASLVRSDWKIIGSQHSQIYTGCTWLLVSSPLPLKSQLLMDRHPQNAEAEGSSSGIPISRISGSFYSIKCTGPTEIHTVSRFPKAALMRLLGPPVSERLRRKRTTVIRNVHLLSNRAVPRVRCLKMIRIFSPCRLCGILFAVLLRHVLCWE